MRMWQFSQKCNGEIKKENIILKKGSQVYITNSVYYVHEHDNQP